MEYLLAGLFCVAIGPLARGAWLLVQDSELRHQLRKELRQKHPHLTRAEIRELMHKRLKELNE